MTENTRTCYTCQRSDCSKFYNVLDEDADKISYLDKLKICILEDLIEYDNMVMCWLCVKHLRMSCKFRETVLMSQELLKLKHEDCRDLSMIKHEVKCETNKNSTVEDNDIKTEGRNNNSSDDSDFIQEEEVIHNEDTLDKDIIETVNSLTEQIKKSATTKKRKQSKKLNLHCHYCGSQFTKRWQLKKHISRVHSGTRRFVCTYCDKEFKQSCHLKEHTTSHTGEKNHSCPICDKKFQRLSSQRRHVKSHDAPPGRKTKRTPFLCTICGKSFPFSNGVQRHMRIHLGIKKFECSMCGRRFTQSTHLQVHMRTHTGEKPYICDTCGEKFSLKSCMLKHINNKHCSSKNSPAPESLPIFYLTKDFGSQFEHIQL